MYNKDLLSEPGQSCPRGSSHPKSKLTEDDVLEIVKLAEEGYTKASIARAFGVSPNNIWFILRGKSWGWLTGISSPVK